MAGIRHQPPKGVFSRPAMNLQQRLQDLQQRIKSAAEACGRSADEVKLVAVGKTMPVETLRAAIEAGVTDLGENYIQECREKFEALASYPVNWHFIGHLQSNKAKYAVRMADLIHSVDSAKLARELDKQAAKAGKVQQILVQVNIAEEASKSGVSESETPALLRAIGQFPNISVQGLMTMPPYFNAPERVRPFFRALRELRDRIRREAFPEIRMKELSMGMTGDFEVAIQEGATLVRVGTALFGERK
jgi:pyridoxal phosphate enzyme (YggS family)